MRGNFLANDRATAYIFSVKVSPWKRLFEQETWQTSDKDSPGCEEFFEMASFVPAYSLGKRDLFVLILELPAQSWRD